MPVIWYNFKIWWIRSGQISDQKHERYLHGKLPTKILAQAANKNIKFMFMKTERLLFSMALEVTVRENSNQTLLYGENRQMQSILVFKQTQ